MKHHKINATKCNHHQLIVNIWMKKIVIMVRMENAFTNRINANVGLIVKMLIMSNVVMVLFIVYGVIQKSNVFQSINVIK